MKKLRLLALMAVAALLLIFPAIVLGQPVPPHVSKLVVSVDGNPAADGTEVTVWMDGTVQVASVTTSDGKAIFKIEGEAGLTGKAINFKVGGIDAAEEDTWEQGGHVNKEFAVSVSSKPAASKPPAEAPKGKAGDKGDKGDTGSKGDTGAAGPSGKAGSAGKDGAAGSAGSAGPAGPAGQDGAAGSAGAAGADGSGGGGTLGIISLILAIVAIIGAGGAFVMGRRGG